MYGTPFLEFPFWRQQLNFQQFFDSFVAMTENNTFTKNGSLSIKRGTWKLARKQIYKLNSIFCRSSHLCDKHKRINWLDCDKNRKSTRNRRIDTIRRYFINIVLPTSEFRWYVKQHDFYFMISLRSFSVYICFYLTKWECVSDYQMGYIYDLLYYKGKKNQDIKHDVVIIFRIVVVVVFAYHRPLLLTRQYGIYWHLR